MRLALSTAPVNPREGEDGSQDICLYGQCTALHSCASHPLAVSLQTRPLSAAPRIPNRAAQSTAPTRLPVLCDRPTCRLPHPQRPPGDKVPLGRPGRSPAPSPVHTSERSMPSPSIHTLDEEGSLVVLPAPRTHISSIDQSPVFWPHGLMPTKAIRTRREEGRGGSRQILRPEDSPWSALRGSLSYLLTTCRRLPLEPIHTSLLRSKLAPFLY
ncbi:hypothetical protein OF83DRAFT_65366 [Amylostereum chailletii]|nr:hypothetical protein OF83DRAFT_65366 [Amylostereum chailletii]